MSGDEQSSTPYINNINRNTTDDLYSNMKDTKENCITEAKTSMLDDQSSYLHLPPYCELTEKEVALVPITSTHGVANDHWQLRKHTFCPQPLKKPRKVKKQPPDDIFRMSHPGVRGCSSGQSTMLNPMLAT
jgi:hypothetical protein